MSSAPIINATLQSVVLAVISNLFAQALQAYRAGSNFTLNTAPVFQFIIFTLLNVPPNYLWQQFLEDTFPGHDPVPSAVEANGSSTVNEKRDTVQANKSVSKKLNLRNTAIKFLFDQTIGCVANTIFFIAGMEALKGANGARIMNSIIRDTWPLMVASYKLWPIVSILSFTVIPVEQRVVFGGIIGVGWNVFLCLFTNP